MPYQVPSPVQPCHTGCPVPSSHAILDMQSCLAVPYWVPSPIWPCRTGCPAMHSHARSAHAPSNRAESPRCVRQLAGPISAVTWGTSRAVPTLAYLVRARRVHWGSAQLPSTGHLVPSAQRPVPSVGYPSAQHVMPSSLPGAPGAHRLVPGGWSGTAGALCPVRANGSNWFPVWATQCPPHPGVSGTQDEAPGNWLPVTGTGLPVTRLGCPVQGTRLSAPGAELPLPAAGFPVQDAQFPVPGARCGAPALRLPHGGART